MKTRDLLSKVMNMATNNPKILDIDVEYLNDNGSSYASEVNYIYVENNKLIL